MPTIPSQIDFVKGVDMTGQPNVQPTNLNNLVDAAIPYTDKGLVLNTTDIAGVPSVPDAATYTKWKNYTWKRQTATTVIVYQWNDNGANDATYLKWQNTTTLAVAPNSITAAMLQNNIIDDSKVSGISASKISGLPTAFPPNGAAGGDLAGSTYPDPVIAPNAVTSTKLSSAAADVNDALRAVGNNHIKLQSIVSTGASGKLAVFGAALQFLRVNAGATAIEAATSIFTQLASVGTSLQVARMNLAATAIEFYTSAFTKSMFSGADNLPNTGIPANDVQVVFAHGLGAVPSYVRVVAKCLSAENGYSIGDEIEYNQIIRAASAECPINVSVDATNVRVVIASVLVPGTVRFVKKGDGSTIANLTRASWIFKAYATL